MLPFTAKLPIATSTNSFPGCLIKLATLSLLLLGNTACGQQSAPIAANASATQAEIFEIPESMQSIKELSSFVEGIDALEPSGQGEQERVAHQRKIARTVIAAAERVFAGKEISDEDAMQSVYLKLQGWMILKELDEPKAEQMFAKAIDAARADKRSDVQAIGTKFMVETGFAQWTTWGEEEKSAWIKNIVRDISAREPEGNQIQAVMTVVEFLGDENGEKYARELLSKVIPHFKSSKDSQIQRIVSMLAGTERRLNLPGNEIELSGTMLDGSTLDWASYRGKVVLVDFWATWCGPCRAEVPNILKMYHAYHDKGFEVLGISLDKTREEAESYIKQTEIPWPTLFSDNPAERFWQHPMVVRYGISGIPRAILVNREGKVVSMTARGENLGRELRRLLGEPVARVKRTREALVQQVSNLPTSN